MKYRVSERLSFYAGTCNAPKSSSDIIEAASKEEAVQVYLYHKYQYYCENHNQVNVNCYKGTSYFEADSDYVLRHGEYSSPDYYVAKVRSLG